ncbi:hypothetical protein Scep_000955 [Stephania cephalantha]|uniref:Uncharacterized protein n=1 Tax=Stephania cephalantha TaxID=152367 RepID=A0AAP0LB57_9MAGN
MIYAIYKYKQTLPYLLKIDQPIKLLKYVQLIKRGSKIYYMGWAGSEMMRCKKHPKHKQSPGVCSVCLGEKLSSLTSTKTSTSSSSSISNAYIFNSSSMSSSLSSAMSSSRSSPTRDAHVKLHGPVSSVLVSGKNGLQRSRSMAFAEARKRVDYGDDQYRLIKEKKKGFWSRLLGTSNKSFDHRRRDPLMQYSRTMKEARVTGLMA